MTKLYIYQIPRETYFEDRRKKHDPKYVRRTWHTEWETTDYNEILEYIQGDTVVLPSGLCIEKRNGAEPVYRVLEQTVVLQEGECVSPYDDCQAEIEAQVVESLKLKLKDLPRELTVE